VSEIATVQPSGALETLLRDPGKLSAIPVETVERLYAIDKDMRAEAARQEFAAAFNRVQGRMTPVKKAAKNTQTGSMYARAEDVDRMLDPLLQSEGFSTSFSTTDCPIADHIRAVLTVRHVGGHEERHYLDAAIDDKGMKGSATKTRLHGMGSTMSYVRRYLKCQVFDVQLGGLDDDGNAGGGIGPGTERITDEQAIDLDTLIENVGANRDGFLKFFAIREIGDLPASRLREARAMLEQRRRRGQGK